MMDEPVKKKKKLKAAMSTASRPVSAASSSTSSKQTLDHSVGAHHSVAVTKREEARSNLHPLYVLHIRT
jgi:hypothetical protein